MDRNELTMAVAGALIAAVLLGCLAGIPLGILAALAPRLRQPVLALAGMLQTVPSLALLAILIPLLGRIGIVTSEGLREKRRYFIVGAFVIAAVLTPPDVLSQLSLAIPLTLLYEASIYSVRIVEKKAQAPASAEAKPEANPAE